jgi:hypothetical protein
MFIVHNKVQYRSKKLHSISLSFAYPVTRRTLFWMGATPACSTATVVSTFPYSQHSPSPASSSCSISRESSQFPTSVAEGESKALFSLQLASLPAIFLWDSIPGQEVVLPGRRIQSYPFRRVLSIIAKITHIQHSHYIFLTHEINIDIFCEMLVKMLVCEFPS